MGVKIFPQILPLSLCIAPGNFLIAWFGCGWLHTALHEPLSAGSRQWIPPRRSPRLVVTVEGLNSITTPALTCLPRTCFRGSKGGRCSEVPFDTARYVAPGLGRRIAFVCEPGSQYFRVNAMRRISRANQPLVRAASAICTHWGGVLVVVGWSHRHGPSGRSVSTLAQPRVSLAVRHPV